MLVPPLQSREGCWFGAGNLTRDASGAFYLVGRYRNAGDSRTGTTEGERGLELAIFRSTDNAKNFSKIIAFTKADLAVGPHTVVSIEGAKLHFSAGGVELFVSTEKNGIEYPPGLESFRKPGTGIWTIDRLHAETVEDLKGKRPTTIMQGGDPQWLHAKDPVVFDTAAGDTLLVFCTHPFTWSSTSSARAVRPRGESSFSDPEYAFFPRGYTWDAAITRITSFVRMPAGDRRAAGWVLVFYDGGESLRKQEEHPEAVRRPRGYSCEELGGTAVFNEGSGTIERLSTALPAFVSPYGTGCSRYVDVLETEAGYYATWQQSQRDRSQPLVMSFLPRDQAERAFRS